jgi:hypothetical protein
MGIQDLFMGKSPELNFEQSPQQQQMYNTMFPAFQNFMGGNMPQQYDVPGMIQPGQGWFSGLDQDIQKSLWEPAREGGLQMMEAMGAKGQIGSAGSPISGSAQTGMGRLFADYSQGIGQQAWNMMLPGMEMDYQAQLGRNISGYNQSMLPFQTAANMLPGTYGSPVVTPGSPGLMQGMSQMAAPMMAGIGMGMGGPIGGALGGWLGGMMNPGGGTGGQFGSGGFASLGGGTNIYGNNMGAPPWYSQTGSRS